MKKIIFICPYFGIMPYDQMQLWLKSCEYNKDINWLIITDDRTEYQYPKNILVKYCDFQDVIKMLQKKFEFPINVKSPYKLCDFKPAYGYIFEDYIREYDFWGHCDMTDCIFGDLSKFLSEDILANNDKIGFLGHLTLYRNTYAVNRRFKIKTNSNKELREILGTSEHVAFDEINNYSINTIYEENGFSSVRIDSIYADISPLTYAFRCSSYDQKYNQYYEKKNPMIFEWNAGKLYQYIIENKQVTKVELGYVHFQKRKMKKYFEKTSERYLIIPSGFELVKSDIDASVIKNYSPMKLLYLPFFKLKYRALRYRIDQIIKRNIKRKQ